MVQHVLDCLDAGVAELFLESLVKVELDVDADVEKRLIGFLFF